MSDYNKSPDMIQVRTWDKMTPTERRQVIDWIVNTCLVFGSQLSTAYRVAAEFARGLDSLLP